MKKYLFLLAAGVLIFAATSSAEAKALKLGRVGHSSNVQGPTPAGGEWDQAETCPLNNGYCKNSSGQCLRIGSSCSGGEGPHQIDTDCTCVGQANWCSAPNSCKVDSQTCITFARATAQHMCGTGTTAGYPVRGSDGYCKCGTCAEDEHWNGSKCVSNNVGISCASGNHSVPNSSGGCCVSNCTGVVCAVGSPTATATGCCCVGSNAL